MPADIKRLIATLSGFPILLCFSLLLHMIDADLSGSEGFSYLIFMPSVYVIAAAMFIPCVVAVIGFGTQGIWAYWSILCGAALLIALMITWSGSTATDMMGYLVSFSGMTLISALFLIPGTLPGVFFLRMNN